MAAVPDGLQTLVEDGVVDEVHSRLMSGKEASVFVVSYRGALVAAKVYKARERRTFKATSSYTEGRNQTRSTRDKRAMAKRSTYGRELVEESWREMEYRALFDAFHGGVRVPKPIMLYEDVLLMDLVVDEAGDPAPRLADFDLEPEKAEAMYREIYEQMRRLLATGKVHGDLSAFNVLIAKDGPTIIDMPQVVDAGGNNQAREILRRDLANVSEHLAKYDARLLRFRDAGDALFHHFQRGTLEHAMEPQVGSVRRNDRPQGGRRADLAERGRMNRGGGAPRQAPMGGPRDDRPRDDRPRDDRPRGGAPAGNERAPHQQSAPRTDDRQPQGPQPQGGRPRFDQQGGGRPRFDDRAQQGGGERPRFEDRPHGASQQHGGGRPRFDHRQQGAPQGERPRFDERAQGAPQQGGERPRFDDRQRQQQGGGRSRFEDRQGPQHGGGERPRFDDRRPAQGAPQHGGRPRFDDRQQGDGRPRFDDRAPNASGPQHDRPRTGGPRRDDRPQGDRPHHDRPQGDRPHHDRPQDDRPHHDRPRTTDRETTDRETTDRENLARRIVRLRRATRRPTLRVAIVPRVATHRRSRRAAGSSVLRCRWTSSAADPAETKLEAASKSAPRGRLSQDDPRGLVTALPR